MKPILALILFPLFCASQESKIDSTTNEYFLDSIIILPGKQEEIFTKEKIWLSKMLSAPTNPNQIIDNSTAMVSSNATFDFLSYWCESKKRKLEKKDSRLQYNGHIKITLFAKDGKAKIIVTEYKFRKDYKYPRQYDIFDLNPKEIAGYLHYTEGKGEYSYYYYDALQIKAAMEKYIHELMINFANYINKKAENDF